MSQKNALEILSQRAKKNPKLQAAYIEEKKRYHTGCKIRECRKRAKLTQKQLAELIGTKQSVISRLENAEYEGHSLNILKKIAEVTQEPLDLFVKEECVNKSKIMEFPIMKSPASFFDWKDTQILLARKHV